MVICTIDHTDDVHNDQTSLDIQIYIWEHLKLELKSKLKSDLKLSNMYAYSKLISLQLTLMYIDSLINLERFCSSWPLY